MLPLLILIVPPTVLGGGYVSWSAGQKLALPSSRSEDPPPDTFASYSAGLTALGGAYGLAEFALGKFEIGNPATHHSGEGGAAGAKADIRNAAGSGNKFVQPKSVGELLGRVGPPVLLRLGAVSMAFFCSGAVQSYVAQSFERSSSTSETVG